VLLCRACGTGRAHPTPTEEALERYYRSDDFEEVEGSSLSLGKTLWDLGPARAAAQVRAVSRWTSHRGSWLDIGAGYGFLLDAARTEGWSTAGTEPGPSRGDSISNRGHQLYDSLSSVEGKWDVISLSHLLEHVTDPVGFLRTIRSLLAPSGLLFCEVPNDAPGAVSFRPSDEPHVVFFSEKGLSKCAQNAGFSARIVTTAGRRRTQAGRSLRDASIRLGRRVLPSSMVPQLHWTFQEGDDRIWIRAIFAPD
jgi:SAM-dependent methyltransferase